MYAQRRGLAQGQVFNDNEARDANANLMKSKRKQNLLAQLQEKEDLLKQYLNPRGIGMRGQTVPQRDIDMLRQQITLIHQQLEEQPEVQSNYTPTPSSAQRQPDPVPQRRDLQPAPMQPPPSSTNSHSSRRDEVWHAKYQLWLQRNQGQINTTKPQMGVPPLHPQTPQQPQLQMHQQSQQQQQQQQPQFGRRATPPTGELLRQQPMQPQSSQGSSNNFNASIGNQSQQAASYGRRASGNRPW